MPYSALSSEQCGKPAGVSEGYLCALVSGESVSTERLLASDGFRENRESSIMVRGFRQWTAQKWAGLKAGKDGNLDSVNIGKCSYCACRYRSTGALNKAKQIQEELDKQRRHFWERTTALIAAIAVAISGTKAVTIVHWQTYKKGYF